MEEYSERRELTIVLTVLYIFWLAPFIVLLFLELWFAAPEINPTEIIQGCSQELRIFVIYHGIFLSFAILFTMAYIARNVYIYYHGEDFDNDNLYCSSFHALISFVCI